MSPAASPPWSSRRPVGVILLVLSVVVASNGAAQRRVSAPPDPIRGLLPPIPRVRGPLRLQVTHPTPNSVLDIADSTFVFGSAGTGDAVVRVAGQPVTVASNGAWLGWVRLPDDDAFDLLIEAARGADSLVERIPLRRRRPRVWPSDDAWIDTLSFVPSGRLWIASGVEVPLRVRTVSGAVVTLRLADGSAIPLVESTGLASPSDGVLAFDGDSARQEGRAEAGWYEGRLTARAIGDHPGTLFGDDVVSSSAGDAVLEVTRAGRTTRARWPLRLALLDSTRVAVRLNDDPLRRGDSDSLTVGRAVRSGSYHWFFRTGTRAIVAARHDDDLLLQLSATRQAWVPIADAEVLPAAWPRPAAVLGSFAMRPVGRNLSLRVPWTMPVPVQVEERPAGLRLTFHSAQGDVDWIRYGGTDPFIRRISWSQRTVDEVSVDIDLAQPLWGWRTRVTEGAFVLELRRPPVINAVRPLAGRRIVIDPGHPPLGATGPTGLREAEANLAVARRLAPLLRARGATVLLTRDADTAVALQARVPFAERLDADLLISIHNNALPDGVEPFGNSGTSVFYNRLPGVRLAQLVQDALVKELGVRSLGVAEGDLALVRGTWVPSVLTEGLFIMIPEHEAALRTAAGQLRYARGVATGIERFLRERAAAR